MTEKDNLAEENRRLKKELRSAKIQLVIFRIVLVLPFLLFYRLFFGRRIVKSFKDLRIDVFENIDDAKSLKFAKVFERLVSSSPKKLYVLFESILIWRIRRGLLVIIIAALPTVFLFQQNELIQEQNKKLDVQNEYFSAQTDLLKIQADDDAISRAVNDMINSYRIDYPQIQRIARKFESLDVVRRKDQINKLQEITNAGYERQLELESDWMTLKSNGQEYLLGRTETIEQYKYLSAFLLINELKANDEANIHWIALFNLDLVNCDFTGAELNEVVCYDCKGQESMSVASRAMVFCDNPESDCEVEID